MQHEKMKNIEKQIEINNKVYSIHASQYVLL